MQLILALLKGENAHQKLQKIKDLFMQQRDNSKTGLSILHHSNKLKSHYNKPYLENIVS